MTSVLIYSSCFLNERCEVEDGDSAEQVSPVTESVAEGHEEFYDLNYVTDKAESTASEVGTHNYSCTSIFEGTLIDIMRSLAPDHNLNYHNYLPNLNPYPDLI